MTITAKPNALPKPFAACLIAALLAPAIAAAQATAEAPAEPAAPPAFEVVAPGDAPFFDLPDLPAGYICVVQENPAVGLTTVVVGAAEVPPGEFRPAIILVAMPKTDGEMKDKAFRVSVVKGFINGIADTLLGQDGGSLAAKKWGSLDTIPIDQPFDVSLDVQMPKGSPGFDEGGMTLIDGRILFDDDRAYQMQLQTRTPEQRAKFLPMFHEIELKSGS